MIEIGEYELIDFAERWRKDPPFREGMQACFEWSIRHEVEIDIVQEEGGGFAVQVCLRDADGPFFTDPVVLYGDMHKRLSASVARARKARIKTVAEGKAA